MNRKLESDERKSALEDLQTRGWSLVEDRDAIRKTFKFDSFVDAWGWMSKMAIEAEKLNHHPEWFNVYNKVIVELTTHDVDGLSNYDFQLAARMEQLASGG